jgi:hypothetical protein
LSTTAPYVGSLSPTNDDIDRLISVLLEKETPLSTAELARILLDQRVKTASEVLAARFSGVSAYNPAAAYQTGQKLVFPNQDYATAIVVGQRDGDNAGYGAYRVIEVKFDDEATREYAAELTTPHALSVEGEASFSLPGDTPLNVDDLLGQYGESITAELDAALKARPDLVRLGGQWFLQELMMDVNVGHINLADAVLEIMDGGPLTTAEILEQIGGLGSAPQSLQEFSLNYAMLNDERFDEVGPAGEVLWYLKRMEPAEVREKPAILRYTPVEYDSRFIVADGREIEAEIDDELSDLPIKVVDSATVRLIYPHRRIGTLPLNSETRSVFPTARRAPRIYITLVDAKDGETFTGWVVHNEGYVFGLNDFYRKHKLPLGSTLTLRRDAHPGHIVIDFPSHKPRTEYIPLMSVRDNHPVFELTTRPIGVSYDDQMILGIDELQQVETLAQSLQQGRKTLVAILKLVIPALTRLSPQGVSHFKTVYSAVNVLRRTPPGLLMATLNANPEFENVAGHYWKLSDA